MPASNRRKQSIAPSGDPWWLTLVLVVLAAIGWWMSQPGMAGDWFGVSTLLWMVLLVRAAVASTRIRWLMLMVWCAFTATWLPVLGWVSDVSVAGWPPLAIYSALYPAIGAGAINWFWRRGVMPLSLIVAIIGTALGYVRAEILFDAWPFHLEGESLWGSPLVMLASVGGIWMCGMLLWSCAGLCVAFMFRKSWWREIMTPGILLMVAMWAWWFPLVHQTSDTLHVLGVQTNLPQSNKMGWSIEQQAKDVPSFLELTHSGLRQAPEVDLVVWPETMVPGFGFEEETLAWLEERGPEGALWARWPRDIAQAAINSGVPWLVGASTWIDLSVQYEGLEAAERYNSAVLLEPDGAMQRVDKVFLTPFGETMPYVRAWPWLEQKVLDLGAQGMQFDLDVGLAPSRISVESPYGNWHLAVPICFEDAVPSVVRGMVVVDGHTVADGIINISNDGWFGQADRGRAAHARAAGFRAVELGRPLVRVANTGVSSLMRPDGRTTDSMAARHASTMVFVLPRYEGTTWQAAFGNWLPRTCVVVWLVGGFWALWRGRSL